MKKFLKSIISLETRNAIRFDFLRLRVALRNCGRSRLVAAHPRLHLGCGRRRIPEWVNVDIKDSDFDLDLSRPLPWANQQFDAILSQHVIEHLELKRELLPLLREICRIARPGAELWVSTPDLAVVCRSYLEDRGRSLIVDRLGRHPGWSVQFSDVPSQQVINYLFHQMGQHKNLFDFELLSWALQRSGFIDCERVGEADLLARFPEFPRRGDDFQSVYVRARVPCWDVSETPASAHQWHTNSSRLLCD
jgi:predicted SAM-dependent methyltransferase